MQQRISETASARHARKILEIVEDALQARGFSVGEVSQILGRLVCLGEDAVWPPAPDLSRRVWSQMPFGKWAGFGLDEIPTAYFSWLRLQHWFSRNYPGLACEVDEILRARATGAL